MTPQEISEKYRELAVRVRRLKAKRLSMGNYEDILKEAWDIIFGLIEAGFELSEAVNALEPPVKVEVTVGSEGAKDG